MPDFNKGSTFNKDANFQGVKFGADAPLLETELNELQDIQTEARADIIRDTIPSGFVQLGELDFDYMLNNENCVKMKTDSVAYVNGYKILIPKDTIVDIGKAPEKDAREDLLFLEVWKEEVTKDSVLTVAGGEGQAQINNPILDDRVGQETSRRVALKWRIRHVADVDFSLAPYGLDYIGTEIIDGQKCFRVAPQGGLESPYYDTDWKWAFRLSNYYQSNGNIMVSGVNELFYDMNDMGLYVSGHKDRKTLKTIDGYVYAIPMFRLYRKPSCGKAIPFEYQKINPKVDYSKFTDLMKEERVERVVNETIQGQSLVNLVIDNSPQKAIYIVKKELSCAKENTDYTIMFELSNVIKGNFTGIFGLSIENDPNSALTSIPFKDGKYVLKVRTKGTSSVPPFDSTKPSYVSFWTQYINSGQSYTLSNVVVLEGDWTNKPLPDYFTGLKSLGEDEGNLITVKNAILNESSYDPDTGTPKLTTVEGANHITSDNLIMPNVEAQVKRGEVKVSDLTSFGKVDNMAGDEVVDFTKIKGRTLQNLHTSSAQIFRYYGMEKDTDFTIEVNNNITTITRLTDVVPSYAYLDAGILNKDLLKPNTVYTLVFEKATNLSRVNLVQNNNQNFISNSSIITNNMAVLTTTNDLTIGVQQVVYITLTGWNTNSVFELGRVMILEGDYTNTPLSELPYVEGIKSVGENEVIEDGKYEVKVKSCGKNLIKTPFIQGTFNPSKGNLIDSTTRVRTDFIKVKPNTQYTRYDDGSVKFRNLGMYNIDRGFIQTNLATSFTTPSDCYYVLIVYSSTIEDEVISPSDFINAKIQLEEGAVATEYEPYKEYKQEITIKEPLRSLPNGICDTIEGNKVIRRVGKVVLDGTEGWNPNTISNTTNDFLRFELNGMFISSSQYVKNGSQIISDIFVYIPIADISTRAYTINLFSNTNNGQIRIWVKTSDLPSPDVQGLKTWLSQNPVTIYYELANPVEELIEPNYDKESIKTYQLDAPLRALPNGVKDEIVDGKLTRRCGEIVFSGKEDEGWSPYSNPTSTPLNTAFSIVLPNDNNKNTDSPSTQNSYLFDKKLACYSATINVPQYDGILGYSKHKNGGLYITIPKSYLNDQITVEAFRSWLKENPMKLIYELGTPIEIPLKEVLPSQANFSLARQFNYSENYLLELPNGVKDTVENGKVTRRVGKAIIDGTGTYERSNNSDSKTLTSHFNIKGITDMKLRSQGIMSNYFRTTPTLPLANCDNIEGLVISETNIWLNINKSRLTSDDVTGLKAWLSNNPLTVLYELATPTTEELSGNNNMYCPSHEINTYCGRMYVGDGTNDVIVENGLKNKGVIIDTPFRSITNKEVVTDCKYKKVAEGYTMDKTSKSANLLDTRNFVNFVSTPNVAKSDTNVYPITLKSPKIKFSIFSNGVAIADGNFAIRFCDKDLKEITWWSTNKINREVELVPNFREIAYICLFHNNSVSTNKTIDGICITYQDGDSSKLVPFVPCEVAFENTEENDIEDLRHITSLTGFNFEQILNESFDKLLRGDL